MINDNIIDIGDLNPETNKFEVPGDNEIGDNVMLDFGFSGKTICPICGNRFLNNDFGGIYSCYGGHRFHINFAITHRMEDWEPEHTKIQRLLGYRVCKLFGLIAND